MRNIGLWGALVVCAVAAGCGGNLPAYGGGGRGGAAGSGDSTGSGGSTGVVTPTDYTWGAVTVRVEPTSPGASGLTLQVIDQATSPTASGTLQFSPTTTLRPTADGAYVAARNGCVARSLYAVEIHSCAGDVGFVPAQPDCLVIAFNSDGTIIGGFDDSSASGVTCTIREGSATLRVPPPASTVSTPGGPPPDAATGTFKLDCQGSDGAILHPLHFEGTFVLPVQSSSLAC